MPHALLGDVNNRRTRAQRVLLSVLVEGRAAVLLLVGWRRLAWDPLLSGCCIVIGGRSLVPMFSDRFQPRTGDPSKVLSMSTT